MLSYTMDVEERSTWLRSTPSPREQEQPFYCTEAGAFYARDRFTTERSDKDSYIVFYTLGGEGVVRQGGQTVTLEKGKALLMDCRQPQSYGTSSGRRHWYHLWAHIDGAGVAAMGDLLGLPTLRPVELSLAAVHRPFDMLFENLAYEGQQQLVQTGLAIHQLLGTMVLAADEKSLSPEQDAVEVARAFMEEHFADDVSVAQVAQVASLSTSQLIRLFKQRLGTTPHNYLLRYRITRAKELLAETTLSVGAISREVGFASESNFSYRFSQMVGQSPSAYRAAAPKLFG